MRPLKVLVLVKDRPLLRAREGRNMGMFSYPVPNEFSWQYATFSNGFLSDRGTIRDQGFDLVFHEDGGNWGKWEGSERRCPVVYHAIDSTLSDQHLKERRRQAAQSDLVLVEHDDPARFAGIGRPVSRLPYAVNDSLFFPRPKTLDVVCVQGRTKKRIELERVVSEYCAARDLRCLVGPLGLPDYAEALGQAKVVVCASRVPSNRPHRVFDALASGAHLLSTPLPLSAAWDGLATGIHYSSWHDQGTLECALDAAFDPLLSLVAQRRRTSGLGVVTRRHTWAVRARELRTLLAEQFPWLA